MLSTGSLKTNNIIASNVTVSTTYEKSSISRNSLDLKITFSTHHIMMVGVLAPQSTLLDVKIYRL